MHCGNFTVKLFIHTFILQKELPKSITYMSVCNFMNKQFPEILQYILYLSLSFRCSNF